MTDQSQREALSAKNRELIERGCTCPVIDNHHGEGVEFRGEVCFWRSDYCPLHGGVGLELRTQTDVERDT
jgi:hypothetical protein